ncbi:MAG: FKBP-type peptidyl-prolyl cis-trans isomerase [Alphaproteobacteria bacterium]|nr:FKBP-type peptidyl-prolyl cis-trans isomerase [Alphaproteobacteria bacterium]
MARRLCAVLVGLLLVCGEAIAADSALSAEANAKFLATSAAQKGVVTRPSGLQYRILQNGSGKHPGPNDTVEVYYTGMLINGTVFDGTEDGFPRSFVTKDLISGWKEALEIMREGDHWRLVIPASLAYGARGSSDGSIPPNQTLVFDLQLLQVAAKTPEQLQQEQAQKARDEESHPGPGAY